MRVGGLRLPEAAQRTTTEAGEMKRGLGFVGLVLWAVAGCQSGGGVKLDPAPKEAVKHDAALCKALVAPHEAALAPFAGRDMGNNLSEPRCFAHEGGTWAVRLDKLYQVYDNPDTGETYVPTPEQLAADGDQVLAHYLGHWSVVFVAKDGTRLEATPQGEGPRDWGNHEVDNFERYIYSNTRFEAQVADYNGDGRQELILRKGWDGHESTASHTFYVLDAVGGQIVPYAPSEGLDIDDARDTDADHKPELFLRSPFFIEAQCGLDGWPYWGPRVVMYADAKGHFTGDGPKSRAALAEQCPQLTPAQIEAKPADYPEDVWTSLFTQAACARIWGGDDAQIKERFLASLPKEEQYCFVPEDFDRWFAKPFPVKLP